MGVFGKINRFREAGEDTNVNNVAEYGEPARSLFTTTKVFTLHHHIDITDAEENVVYTSNSKAISIRDKTQISDASGALVSSIERKIISIRERHYITMADGVQFEMSNEILHIIKDITNIEGLGWKLKGNIVGLNFQLYDQYDRLVAVISQKMISIHDKYCIDIYMPEHEAIVITILVTLQHMMRDRKNTVYAAGAASRG